MRCTSTNERITLRCHAMPAKRRSNRSQLLSRSEEIDLGKAALAGDLAARDVLVESNIGLAYHLAGRSGWRTDNGIEIDDLKQEALLALIVCAERFDPVAHPDVKFGTFAGFCIIGRLRTYCAKNRRREFNNLDMDQFPDPGTLPPSFDKRHADAVLDVVDKLPDADRELVELHYGLGDVEALTFAEIGARLAISKQAVHQKVSRSIARIGDAVRRAA
jgi:RNA polymerase sigma factor (sigma-70 family)